MSIRFGTIGNTQGTSKFIRFRHQFVSFSKLSTEFSWLPLRNSMAFNVRYELCFNKLSCYQGLCLQVLLVYLGCILFHVHVIRLSFAVCKLCNTPKSRNIFPTRFCIKRNNHGSGAVIRVFSSLGNTWKRFTDR